jgi:hypothetical protein
MRSPIHRRGDIWWNLAATLVLAFNWSTRSLDRISRLPSRPGLPATLGCCSASVEERCDYAPPWLVGEPPGLIAACALNSASQLKRRLGYARHRVSQVRSAAEWSLTAVAMAARDGAP